MVKKSVSLAIGQSKPLNENVSMIDGPAVALANPCFRSTKLALAIPFFAGIKLTATMAVLVPELVSPNSIGSIGSDLDRIDWLATIQNTRSMDDSFLREISQSLRAIFSSSLFDRGRECYDHLNMERCFRMFELWINVHAGINDGADILPSLATNEAKGAIDSCGEVSAAVGHCR